MAKPRFGGFDHVDCRVRSLSAVQDFYDALMPELGLPEKRFSYVDESGDWHEPTPEHPYNTVEYYEERQSGRVPSFIGFIERSDHEPGLTRIAFAVSRARLTEMEPVLRRIGAGNMQWSEDMDAYAALFFEDPTGTKLELVARSPKE